MSAPHVALPAGMRVFERGWLSANNILFIGRDTALVDSGYLSHAPQTLALLRHALQDRHLDRLFNTHLHSDHCGGNALLQRTYGCRTTIPAAEADAVRHWNEDKLSFRATGQQCEGFSFDATWQPGDVALLGDMQWQVLGAAGHDPHSIILYSPQEKILISADALWQDGFGVIFPELEGNQAFAAARATLESIASLDIRLVIPGHGPMFHEKDAALERAFSRLDYLAADPARNARNGVKVLLKFLLLERRSIPLADLEQTMTDIPLIAEANRRYLNMTSRALAEWAVAQLVRAGAARTEAGALVDHG